MTLRLPWRKPGLRQRKLRFSTTLQSNLPGAVFNAQFVVRWRAGLTPERAEPFLRIHLHQQADNISVAYPVDQIQPVADEIQVAIASQQLHLQGVGTIETSSTLQLSTSPQSLQLQEHRSALHRKQQITAELEHARIQALCNTTLAHRPAALIWAATNFPALTAETRGDMLQTAIDQLHTERVAPANQHDPRHQAAHAITTWLTSDAAARQEDLQTLRGILTQIGDHETLIQHLDVLTTAAHSAH